MSAGVARDDAPGRPARILCNPGAHRGFRRRPAGSPAAKILVVDDEEAIRDSLDLVLRFEHHDDVWIPVFEPAEGA